MESFGRLFFFRDSCLGYYNLRKENSKPRRWLAEYRLLCRRLGNRIQYSRLEDLTTSAESRFGGTFMLTLEKRKTVEMAVGVVTRGFISDSKYCSIGTLAITSTVKIAYLVYPC
jgi:hypothetical protein